MENQQRLILRRFLASLRKEVKGRRVEVSFLIYGTLSIRVGETYSNKFACIKAEDGYEEGLYYTVLGDTFFYNGDEDFILDEDLLELVNDRLKETLKQVAVTQKSAKFCFVHRNQPKKAR